MDDGDQKGVELSFIHEILIMIQLIKSLTSEPIYYRLLLT